MNIDTNIDERTITRLRYEAARMEHEAASIRLATARAESVSATRTLAMADAIAASMAHREGLGGGEPPS